MEITKGTKVVVTEGPPNWGVTAHGTYDGTVDLFALVDPKTGDLVVSETPFSPEAKVGMAEMKPILGNPRIVLEDGTVVYGCQVWWQEAEEERPVGC